MSDSQSLPRLATGRTPKYRFLCVILSSYYNLGIVIVPCRRRRFSTVAQDRLAFLVNSAFQLQPPQPATPRSSDAFDLNVPLPRTLSATGERHCTLVKDGWRIYSPSYAPPPRLDGHLTFALKHEGVDLAILKRLFAASGPSPIEAIVRAAPTGAYARRIWFLYEWLMDRRLGLPNADRGAYPLVVDPKRQYTVAAVNSSRHRIKNNLPGTSEFSPLVSAYRAAGPLDRLRPAVASTRGCGGGAPRPPGAGRRASAARRLPGRATLLKVSGRHRPASSAGATPSARRQAAAGRRRTVPAAAHRDRRRSLLTARFAHRGRLCRRTGPRDSATDPRPRKCQAGRPARTGRRPGRLRPPGRRASLTR